MDRAINATKQRVGGSLLKELKMILPPIIEPADY